MFGSKSKVQLPPRPQPPVPEQMVEDLENDTTDVVFQFVNEVKSEEIAEGTTEDIYSKFKIYLEISKNFRTLENKLENQMELLEKGRTDMTMLVEEIKREAEAALET